MSRARPLILGVWLSLAGHAGAAEAGDGTATPAGRSQNIPADKQQAIIDHFAVNFVLRDMVIWKFVFSQPYPTGGIAVCGTVNYPDSTRRYVGSRPFYARFVDGKIVTATIVVSGSRNDPAHASADAYKIACGDS
jgi:hypothetical protein